MTAEVPQTGVPQTGIPQNCRAFQLAETAEGVRGGFTTVPVGELGRGELLIRASLSSVNYKDALAATGRGKVARRLPLVGGIDVAGAVETSDDPRFTPGERVLVTGFGLSEDCDGGYAEWVRVPADWAVPVPVGMTDWEAMALGTAGITSALAVHELESNGVRPGDGPVVVTGATGGSGSLAVSMLAGLGYDVTAVTGNAARTDYLQQLGASRILPRPEVPERPRPLESAEWAGAVDCVGGQTLAWLIRTMRRHGVIATFGNAGGNDLPTSVLPFILRGVRLIGVNTGYFDNQLRHALWQRMAGDLRPSALDTIARTVGFDDLPASLESLVEGANTGRVVVELR